jgi:indole-3-glycerol phosphate synthase
MILDEIVADKRRAHAARKPLSLERLWQDVRTLLPARSLNAALRAPGAAAPRVIAEFKRRSPSAGPIRPGADAGEIAAAYAEAGASALSILTDERFFDGRMQDLQAARAKVALPLLRKDFLLDDRDLLEARLGGADAALLIVRILPRAELAALIRVAAEAGLEVLVEAHTAEEIDAALAAGARIVGVNHRDLDTLAIDLSLSARARTQVGPVVTLVAESGIQTRADVARMREHGADAILVGESLMRAPEPGRALEELLSCS